MSIDYIVRFGEEKPTTAEVKRVIVNFLDAARDSWVGRNAVRLCGKSSHPLQNIDKVKETLAFMQKHGSMYATRREFTFNLDADYVMFSLYGQDEYVQACVEGICKAIARCWGGKLELPS